MQTFYLRDYNNLRRRVHFQLVDQTDGITPKTAEAGGQPQISKQGAAGSATNVGVLVAINATHGLYYSELAAGALDTLGIHEVFYDSANTLPASEVIEVVPHPWLDDGTAQAGAASTITLRAGASATDNVYRDAYARIIDGTGIGQVRQISGYVGATKVATVDQSWTTNPDATSVYVIEPGAKLADIGTIWDAATASHAIAGSFGEYMQPIRRNTAQTGGANSITLDAGASATDSFYNNQIIRIVAGTGVGQTNIIASYVGSSKVATVSANWAIVPDATSVFLLIEFGKVPGASAPTAGENATAVWDTARVDHAIAGSFGAGVGLDTTTMQAVADALLARSVGGGSNSFPSVKFGMCFLAGKWTDNQAGTITVYDVDDTTVLGTITYTTAARDSIASVNSSA